MLSVAEYNVLHAHGGAGVGKQLLKKISSRLPLMKELSRLGFAESLPDFVSKDLRRRRNMANVQVLFSQSLNDNIREKQKKVLHFLLNDLVSNYILFRFRYYLFFRSWGD